MGHGKIECVPVKVPVDAPFEDIVRAYEIVYAVANHRPIGRIVIGVEDMRPDLALRIVDDLKHSGPSVLYTFSLSCWQIKQAPCAAAERQAHNLVELLQHIGWREQRSAPPLRSSVEQVAAARHIAELARTLEPADWPGWSTSEQIVAALATDRPSALPELYKDAGDAWARMDTNQRKAIYEINPGMARLCENQATSKE